MRVRLCVDTIRRPACWALLTPPCAALPTFTCAGDKGYELYRWATAAVSSYSFILGDDKYQVSACTQCVSSLSCHAEAGARGYGAGCVPRWLAQAMVPYWDALNHTTGAVNVRLNHHTTK